MFGSLQDDTEIALFSLFQHQNFEYFLILLNKVHKYKVRHNPDFRGKRGSDYRTAQYLLF